LGEICVWLNFKFGDFLWRVEVKFHAKFMHKFKAANLQIKIYFCRRKMPNFILKLLKFERADF